MIAALGFDHFAEIRVFVDLDFTCLASCFGTSAVERWDA